MKNCFYTFFFIFHIILLQSCDHVYDSRINNKSSNNISVTIFYDRQKLDSIYKFDVKSYNAYLRYLVNNNSLPFRFFDSANLTTKYIIPKNAQLVIEHGMNSLPSYIIISKIEISVGDKLTVYKNQSLNTVFKKKSSGLWELEIK